jgi:hypothetical protein
MAVEDTPGRDSFMGYGRVNMNDAISASLQNVLNPLITFDPMEATFTTIVDAPECPIGFLGKFTFEAEVMNVSRFTLSNLSAQVVTLTNENLLLTAKRLPGGTWTRVLFPRTGDFFQGALAPGRSARVPFEICLKRIERFELFVDVMGAIPLAEGP